MVSFSEIKQSRGDMLLFLTMICHQQYSELKNIPEDDVYEMQEAFSRWMGKIFGNSSGKENLKKIALGLNLKEFEEYWSEENRESRSRSNNPN